MLSNHMCIPCIEQSAGGITAGTQWLIWSYESDSTLEDAIDGRLGVFPQSLADLFVRNYERFDEEEVERKVCAWL